MERCISSATTRIRCTCLSKYSNYFRGKDDLIGEVRIELQTVISGPSVYDIKLTSPADNSFGTCLSLFYYV